MQKTSDISAFIWIKQSKKKEITMTTKTQPQKKLGFRPVTWLTMALILLIAAAVMLFVVNQWSITITIHGQQQVMLEYGESYTDEGADAVLHGSLFFKKGWPVEVTAHNTVDVSKIGSYPITYVSQTYGLSATQVRMVTVRDTQPPEITLKEIPDSYTLPGAVYEEEGYEASDNYDGDITDQVHREEKDGKVYYRVKDSSGNETNAVRTIHYDDPIPPEVTLKGDKEIQLTAGTEYSEPGWKAEDNCDGDLTDNVKIKGSVDIYSAGTYELTYSVKDSYGNKAKAVRKVTVTPIRQPDTVTPGGKIIYLTFDDGPSKYTQGLLDTLAEYNVKATFFTCNTGYTSLIAKEAAAGHSVGIHSASHDYSKIYTGEEAFFADLEKQRDLICQQTGLLTTLIRFPGGSSNTVSKRYCSGVMTQLTKDVTDLGYQYFDWNVLSGDAGETTSTDTVFQNVINGVQNQKVSIVLQHDTQGFSVNAVGKIIAWGLSHGYTFLPLDATSPTAHQQINN